MAETIRLNTRNKPALLDAMMRSLVSENSRISFEGKLKNAGLSEIDGASSNESTILKRATTWPTQD